MERVSAWRKEVEELDAQISQCRIRQASLIASIKDAGGDIEGLEIGSRSKRSRCGGSPRDVSKDR